MSWVDLLLWAGRFLFAAVVYSFLLRVGRAVLLETEGAASLRAGLERGTASVGPGTRSLEGLRAPAPQRVRLVAAAEPVYLWRGEGPPRTAPDEAVPAGWDEVAVGQWLPLVAPLRIGRGPDNELRLLDAFASARHARIVAEAGEFWIEDCGSTNGTYVNGERVMGRRRLGSGDTIRIGGCTLQCER